MYLVHQCSNCGRNVRPELGVATAVTVQHRECADRFGLGTHGQSIALRPFMAPSTERLGTHIVPNPRPDLISLVSPLRLSKPGAEPTA
jgi:hypothetical protein